MNETTTLYSGSDVSYATLDVCYQSADLTLHYLKITNDTKVLKNY